MTIYIITWCLIWNATHYYLQFHEIRSAWLCLRTIDRAIVSTVSLSRCDVIGDFSNDALNVAFKTVFYCKVIKENAVIIIRMTTTLFIDQVIKQLFHSEKANSQTVVPRCRGWQYELFPSACGPRETVQLSSPPPRDNSFDC